MYKIFIKGYFKNYNLNEIINYNNEGFLIGNIITFSNNETNLKLILKNNRISFIKEDNKSKLEHEFILNTKTFSKYILKKDNLSINIPIYTTKVDKKDKSIRIEYDLLDELDKKKNIIYIEYEVLK